MSETATTPPLSPQDTMKLSKLLAYVLRHGAVNEKLTISPDGYIAIQDLLARNKFKDVTIEQIRYVVDTNDKKRYELLEQRPGVYYIRASQGHSLKSVESQDLLEEIKEPVTTPVIHGTSNKAWESIKIQGLSKMRRNHVHFAIGLPGDENVKSGMRKTSEVFIYIDVEKARTDGIMFYRSKNDVILSSGIDGFIAPEYFKIVVDNEGKELFY